jgi:hypothetical protein
MVLLRVDTEQLALTMPEMRRVLQHRFTSGNKGALEQGSEYCNTTIKYCRKITNNNKAI